MRAASLSDGVRVDGTCIFFICVEVALYRHRGLALLLLHLEDDVLLVVFTVTSTLGDTAVDQ